MVSGDIINNNFIQFFPFYYHIPIEQKLRKFLGSLFQAHACTEWALLKSINDNIISNDVDWKTTWALMKNLTGFRCNNERKHHAWTFASKMIHNLLPWGRLLIQRNNRSYNTLRCLSCEEDLIEDLRHIRECQGLKSAWQDLHKDMTEYMHSLLHKATSSRQDPSTNDEIRRTINKVLGFNIDSLNFVNFRRFAVKAKIHTTSSRYIRYTLGLSDLAVTNITTRLLLQFIRLFKQYIWNPRCTKLKDWEKDHNIIISRSSGTSIHGRPIQRSRRSVYNSFVEPNDDIIVYDDIRPEVIDPPTRHSNIHTRLQRRIEALPRTWEIMLKYAQDNVLPTWISKSTKYFNGKVKLIEEWIT